MLEQLHFPLELGAETPLMLLILIALEAVLSADNAIALAAIAQGLEDPKLQRQALNLGIVVAYVLRVGLIVTATWIMQFWEFELIGAAYLLWLVFNYFTSPEEKRSIHHGLEFNSLWQAIPAIALTDLAFSLDSVTAAIAVVDKTWLVVLGGTIGIITLRFLAGLFIRLLDEYTHLEDAGFITVGIVGIRLLFRVVNPAWNLPEWLMTAAVVAIFIWGFSERTELDTLTESEEEKSQV